MSNLTITNVGINAAIAAGNGGPMVKITHFKIGTNAGFSPDASATEVSGLIYEGSSAQLSYSIANTDSIIYRVTLDENVGNFEIGNIGLYLEDGTLFALGSLPTVTQKVRAEFPISVGNRKVYDLMLTLSGVANIVDLTILVSNETSLPRVSTQAQLPNALYSPYNAYVVDVHTDYGVSAVAVAVGGRWMYSLYYEYPDQLLGGVLLFPPDMFDDVPIGKTCWFNAVVGKFQRGDGIDLNKGVIGVRGSQSTIIVVGKYVHSEDIYFPGGKYFANGGASAGEVTLTPTRVYVGVARTSRELLVNIGFGGEDRSTQNGSVITFLPDDFSEGVDEGDAIYFRQSSQRFDLSLGNDLTRHVLGVRGPANTLIAYGRYTAPDQRYVPGAMYYVDPAVPGALSTTETKMFVGVALNASQLLVCPSINRTTVQNLGTGTAVVKGMLGSVLQARTLVAGAGVAFTVGENTLTIENLNPTDDGGGGDITTASNVGTGYGVFADKSGSQLNFKSLVAGTGMAITATGSTLTLNLDISNIIDVGGGTIEGDVVFVNLGRALLADGTRARPALAWAKDTGMGWYRIGESRAGFAINDRLIYETNSDGLDFGYNRLRKARITSSSESVQKITASGTALNINAETASLWSVKLSANCTIVFSGQAPADQGTSFMVELQQPTNTAYSVTWPNNIKWDNDEAPDLSLSGRMDIFVFYTHDGGLSYRGFKVGTNISY